MVGPDGDQLQIATGVFDYKGERFHQGNLEEEGGVLFANTATFGRVAVGLTDARAVALVVNLFENPFSDYLSADGWFSSDTTDEFSGTGFDTAQYGFDILTSFTHGNSQEPLDNFGANFDSIREGLLITGGNWRVDSVTTNTPGFWVGINAAISDGYQPGRSNIIQTTASAEVAKLWDPLDQSNYGLLDINDVNFATSYLTGWSTGLAEIDPLVLDLDEDGIELTPFSDQQIYFDMDNDGALERTGWVGADDAMLVDDRNGDGQINDITETLSEYYGAAAGTGAVYDDGFDALSVFDSNNDGRVDASDANFGSLKIWQDENQNGRSEADELKTLDEAGITAISLHNSSDGSFTGGNEVRSRSTYKIGDRERTIASVNFISDPNGLTQEAQGSGTTVTIEGGSSVYTAGDEKGETINLALKGVTSGIGSDGDDDVIGDENDNWLVGGRGKDRLNGGAGNDYIVADAEDLLDGQDGIHGGSGFDVVQFVGNKGVTFHMQQSQVEMAIGTAHDDVLAAGSSDQAIINGGAGDDMLLGGSADDVLNGEEGTDILYGFHGDDLLRGHRGSDMLNGGDGNDILLGGLGQDILYGEGGEDLLDGGTGNDRLDGGDGYDVAEYSGSYADYLVTKNADGSYTVADRRANGADGVDSLANIEALNFADINEVQLDGGNPMPVKDTVRLAPQADGHTYRIPVSNLLSNDLDYQEDDLQIQEVFAAVGGTVSISGNEVVFVVAEGFAGIPTFSYKIRDEHGNRGLQVGVTGTNQSTEMTAKVTLVLEGHPQDPQFLEQWYLPEINVLPVWEDYTGQGVRVGIFEPGPWNAEDYGQVDYSHPDLLPNIDDEALRTQNPNIEPTQHATLVAGVIGAARNDIGSVGVAYDATLTSEGIRESDLNPLFNWQRYDIANNSWGTEDLFANAVVDQNGNSVSTTLLEQATGSGRIELGTIVVVSGGNDRQEGHDTNAHDLTNSRYSITVGAINAEGDLGNLQIAQDPFSNPGASILVSAPGSNVTSTSRLVENDNGSTFGDDYEATQGTSFAAPIVSGVVALMLEANPLLGWRDVQEILALSAKQVDDPSTEWSTNGASTWNGGGMHYSHDYGFGLVDAHAAVRLAETWQERSVSANEITVAAESDAKDLAIPDNGRALRSTISVGEDIALQNIEVLLDLQHQQLGDLEIILVGPDGTESILINRPGVSLEAGSSDRGYGNFNQTWLTTSTNHWAGQSAGDWTLIVKDTQSGKTGTLQNWELRLYGDQAADNSTYVYTNEFAEIGTRDRTIITDTEGLDIINTSAVSGDVVIDLSGTHQTSISGKSITFSSGTVIENAFSGDGNDKLYGNAAANTLSGGRGNDELYAHFEETTEEVAGNRVYLQGDKQVRQLTGDVDIISIEDAQEFYVSSTSVGITSSGGQLVALGSNHYAGFDVNNDLVDLSSLTSVSSFEDLIITNRITLNNITWAGIAAPDGGMILLAGVDAADLTSNNFIFADQSAGDTLYGGEGDDKLFSSSGSDHLDGGAGNDLAIYADGKDNYAISILNNKVLITDTRDGTSDTLVDVEVLQFNGIKYQVTDLINFKPEVGTVNLGSLAEDNSRLITQTELLSQTVDINGDALAISSVAVDPGFGTMMDQGNGSWLFTPSANFHGENVEISFVVSDGEFEVPAKALLDITSVNDAPEVILIPPTQTALEGSTWQYVLPANSFKDADGDDLVITAALADGSPLPDWLEFDTQTQAFSGIPPTDSVSSLDIKVTASDGSISTSLPLQLQIEAANSAPTLFQPILDQNTDEDEVWTFTLPVETFVDADDDTLAYSATLSDGGALPSWLSFDASAQALSGTPPQDFNGRISLVVIADDGLETTSAAFDLTVAPINDAPVATIEQSFSASKNQESIIEVSAITDGFRDVDGDDLIVLSVDSAQHGTAVLTAEGNIVFTPEKDYIGEASITYTVSDGHGGNVSGSSMITVAEQVDFDPATLDGYIGTTGDDNIRGGFEDDEIFGDKGDDELDGSFGADTYYYRKDDGNDVISDSFGESKLILTDLSAEDISISREDSFSDVVIKIIATDETITFSWHADISISFADGTTWTPEDVTNNTTVMERDPFDVVAVEVDVDLVIPSDSTFESVTDDEFKPISERDADLIDDLTLHPIMPESAVVVPISPVDFDFVDVRIGRDFTSDLRLSPITDDEFKSVSEPGVDLNDDLTLHPIMPESAVVVSPSHAEFTFGNVDVGQEITLDLSLKPTLVDDLLPLGIGVDDLINNIELTPVAIDSAVINTELLSDITRTAVTRGEVIQDDFAFA
ncbi:cadherin-like domain-containing protein [Pseudovibrio sp. Ad37]|uniref:cadherin-like domain-containing protein n=4 Tax=unclassified Pseudovibrio TaxID=2627060 RepID=UPI001FCC2646|nr:cadherin-like domain-containing protein [Pseudovibrio sp. Ad37]